MNLSPPMRVRMPTSGSRSEAAWNNFGIVTSFTMKTFKSGDIWGGVTYYMPGTFSEVIRNACDFVQNETDEDVQVMCSAGYGFGHQVVTCVMYHTLGKENPPSLQRFTAVQPQIEQIGDHAGVDTSGGSARSYPSSLATACGK